MQNTIQTYLDELNNLETIGVQKAIRALLNLPKTDTRLLGVFTDMAKDALLIDGIVNQKWLPDVLAWLKANCYCEPDEPYQVAFYTVEGKRVNVTLMGYFWNPILRRKIWTKNHLPAWLSKSGITSDKPLVWQVHKSILHELGNNSRKPYAARKTPPMVN